MARNLSRRGWLRSALAALLGPWAARLVGAPAAAAAAPAPAPAPQATAGARVTTGYDAVGSVVTYCYDTGPFPLPSHITWSPARRGE
jgi:hypothetical protein